jgi:hypothetical protein
MENDLMNENKAPAEAPRLSRVPLIVGYDGVDLIEPAD